MNGFRYEQAFARNLGLLTEPEQACLQRARVALPGLGGVGGAHLQALARLGIGGFHLADLDTFEIANIQRQLGAAMSSLGRPKVQVMAAQACDINPELQVRSFVTGVTESNVAAFLEGVDLAVDGLEFFGVATRRMFYRECRARKIPVIMAGPIGFGASVLVFSPEGISLDAYFGLDDSMTYAEQVAAFGLGLAPGFASDIDPARLDPHRQTGPALISACLLCAAAAATEALKILLGRGPRSEAPHGLHYDPYRGRIVRLRSRPPLTRSLRGRVLRWLAFRRFPGLQDLHERELAERRGLAGSSFALGPVGPGHTVQALFPASPAPAFHSARVATVEDAEMAENG